MPSPQDYPFPLSFISVHGGFIFAIFMVLMGFRWWKRGQPIREKYPERAEGYKKILLWFVGVMSGFFLLTELAVLMGRWESIFSIAEFENYGFFEWFMVAYMFGSGLLLNYWVFFRRGADYLAKHPGYFNSYDEKWNRFWFQFHALLVPLAHVSFLYGIYINKFEL